MHGCHLKLFSTGLSFKQMVVTLAIAFTTSVSCASGWGRSGTAAPPSAGSTKPGTWTYGPTLNSDWSNPNKVSRNQVKLGQVNFLQWNVKNHFVNSQTNKPVGELKAMARLIQKVNPDIMIQSEVSDLAAMNDFNQKYLNSEYRTLLIEGNDGRGIDVCMYVRNELPIDIEERSFKDLQDQEGIVFSRDAATFILKNVATGNPMMAIVAVHLKSMRDVPGDPKGLKKRTREVIALTFVLETIKLEFGKNFPVIISGDFNNDILTAPEFDPLRTLGFQDAVDLSGYQGPRFTHYYFANQGKRPDFKALDASLLDVSAQKKGILVSASILPHVDPRGQDYPDPKTLKEAYTADRPSDHKPTQFIIDFTKLP